MGVTLTSDQARSGLLSICHSGVAKKAPIVVYNILSDIRDSTESRKVIMITKEAKTSVIQTEIPEGLLAQAQDLVAAGWFRNIDDLMLAALRRFLESHRGELMEEFIHQDVEWGLKGDE
jgi:hypothetical protein